MKRTNLLHLKIEKDCRDFLQKETIEVINEMSENWKDKGRESQKYPFQANSSNPKQPTVPFLLVAVVPYSLSLLLMYMSCCSVVCDLSHPIMRCLSSNFLLLLSFLLWTQAPTNSCMHFLSLFYEFSFQCTVPIYF